MMLAPIWVAPTLTVAVFVVTTALGFFLMRVAFNTRPVRRRLRLPRSPAAATVDGKPPDPAAGGRP